MKRAAARMAKDKGITRSEALAALSEMKDELARLVALQAYVEWAQRPGLPVRKLAPGVGGHLARMEWFNREPFENVKLETWFALADEALFAEFAESEGLRDGIGLQDVMKMPDESWAAVHEHGNGDQQEVRS